MPLDDLLDEVIRGKVNGTGVRLLSDEELTINYNANAKESRRVNIRPLAVYGLGNNYGSTYFTRREAECMVLLLKGKTINNVATSLSLSPRTVEYYIKNMKTKLGCRTKFELVELVYTSEFMKNVDF